MCRGAAPFCLSCSAYPCGLNTAGAGIAGGLGALGVSPLVSGLPVQYLFRTVRIGA